MYGFLVLLGVVTLVFFLFNILPGDPARMMLGQRADEESIAIINRDLGRDKPLGLQYIGYLNDLAPLSLHNNADSTSFFFLSPDKYSYATLLRLGTTSLVVKAPYLRRSYQSQRKVSEIIATAFPQTAILALVAMLFALVVGITLGVVCALHKDTWIDRTTLVLSTLGMSCPPSSPPSSSPGSSPTCWPTGRTSTCSATSSLSTTTARANTLTSRTLSSRLSP